MSNTGSMDVDAVLELSLRGFYVFPLHNLFNGVCSCGRPNCSIAKHPRVLNWTTKASNDPATIKVWWAKWPDANVGVATGRRSGLIVVDVDDKHAESGSKSLRQLEEKYGPLPSTLTAITGAGKHHYFRHPKLTDIRCSTGKLGDGLDIRADGGYVVCPPSKHANGRTTKFVVRAARMEAPPDWWLDWLTTEDVPDFPT